MTNVIDFQSIKHFVVIYLLLPGAEQTAVNTYPNCWTEWRGDTLNVFPDGMSTPRASYHRSVVMVMEEHGLPAGLSTGKPPQTGQNSPVRTSGSPAAPNTEQTQQMAPVAAAERMQPTPKPSVAEMQDQHIANLREIAMNLPEPTPHSQTALETIEKAKRNYAERQRSFGQVEKVVPPGSPIESTSEGRFSSAMTEELGYLPREQMPPVPSRWQSLRQIVRRSDGEQIEMSYRSGSTLETRPTSHRLPKFFKTRKWARRTKRAVVLAFALYAASFWPEAV